MSTKYPIVFKREHPMRPKPDGEQGTIINELHFREMWLGDLIVMDGKGRYEGLIALASELTGEFESQIKRLDMRDAVRLLEIVNSLLGG